MKVSLSILVLAFAGSISAAPTASSYVVHEKRDQIHRPRGNGQVKRDTILPVSIALKQRNLDKGYDYLMEVAHPDSPKYGQHWSAAQIAEVFGPSDSAVSAIKSWLAENGIGENQAQVSKGLNWVRFNATIGEVESLLRTEYKMFSHEVTGKPVLGCDEYSIPEALQDHIDFIKPTIQFDITTGQKQKLRRSIDDVSPKSKRDSRIVTPVRVEEIQDARLQPLTSPLATSTCGTLMTPACIRSLYDIPEGTLDLSSFGIVELGENTYLQSDLEDFYSLAATNVPSGTAPIFDSIDGGVGQTEIEGTSTVIEGDLDMEYGIALVSPQKVTIYQVGDQIIGGSFDTLLDGLDASYCTEAGGDVSPYDPVYPDGLSTESQSGYDAKDCGKFAPASVISISYSSNENIFPVSYVTRMCNEFMKLGLQGVTVILSSGDQGVAGAVGGSCTEFIPGFPASCPFVTVVGGTTLSSSTSLTAGETASTSYASGGGFSNVFAVPSYQASAISNFMTQHKPAYTSAQFNNTAKTRGYPDLSATSQNFYTITNGVESVLDGTSTSAPVVGSIITLINNERISAGKKPVGFINPTLYANPSAFNDITTGSNPGCGTNGFAAGTGWDPVTGLGTPNFPELLEVFMALP